MAIIRIAGDAFQIAPSIIDDDGGQRRLQQRRPVGVIIAEQAWDSGHQLDRCHRYPPGKHGTVCCSHSEADHQSVLRRPIEKDQRQVRHHLGRRAQTSHSYPIDQQVLLHAFTGRDASGRVVGRMPAGSNWSSNDRLVKTMMSASTTMAYELTRCHMGTAVVTSAVDDHPGHKPMASQGRASTNSTQRSLMRGSKTNPDSSGPRMQPTMLTA